MTDDTKANSSPAQIRFKVAKTYGSRVQVQRRKTIQNFYEFQKKCLELSADYYEGLAKLLEETDVSLFLAPPTPGADPLNIINETGMVMSGMLGPGMSGYVNDRYMGGKLLKKRVIGEDFEVNDNNSEEAYYSENQKAPKHRRAPRQLWSDEEVERLKTAHDRYNGDWELIIKEFEPERTRIQIFQKARQMGLRAVESGKTIDLSRPNTIIEYNNKINNNNSSSNINNNEDGSRIENEGEEDEEIEDEKVDFESNSRIEIKNEDYTDPKEK